MTFPAFFVHPGMKNLSASMDQNFGKLPFLGNNIRPSLPLSLPDFLPDCWDRWDR